MSFYIIKKSANNFWHLFNNNTKEVNASDYEIILDAITQTVSIQMPNGSNLPKSEVPILEVIVIDESGASLEETFANVEDLRARLVALQYTPYLSATGIPEAPIDGQQYARKDAEWIVVSGGGPSGFNKIIVWNGTSTISAVSGFSGTILNYNNGEIVTYTVAGSNITITGAAEAGNTLIITSN